MTVRMEITTSGEQAYLAALRRAAERAEDLTPLMDSIGMGLEASTIERFNETSRGPDGTEWPPSAAATAAGRRTLVRRGHLRDSITHEADRRSVTVGTNVLYAAVHQFGIDKTVEVPAHKRTITQVYGRRLKDPKTISVKAHKRKMKLPARPFLGVSAEDEEMILGESTDWLEGAFVERAGGGEARP